MIKDPKVGDEVWIDRTEYVETVEMIREPQIIEGVTPVPVTDEHGNWFTTYAIDIVGSGYIYSEEDLRRVK